MAGAATRKISAVLALAIVGAAVWFARPTDVAPPRVEATSAPPAASTKRVRHDDAPSSCDTATDHVIAGRVTGLAAGVTARVEARRVDDCPARCHKDRPEDPFAAPPQATPVAAGAPAAPDGAFSLTVTTVGTYLVTATLSDGRDASRNVELPDVLPRVDVDIAVPVDTNTLRGRVVRADGAPFKGWISIERSEEDPTDRGKRWAAPDLDGRFAFYGLCATRFEVAAVVPGEATAIKAGVAVPNADEVMLAIGGGPQCRGRVVADADGSPIVGARVESRSRDEHGCWDAMTSSDASGTFVVRGADDLLVSASASGFYADQVYDKSGGRDEIVVRMRRCGVISGRLLRSSDGSPVAGAVVRTSVRRGWERLASATSAADGSYRLENLPPGRHDVFVLGGGWASVALATWSRGNYDEDQDDPFAVDVAPGATETLDQRVEPTARIAGRVVGPTGAVLRGVRVELESDGGGRKGPRWIASTTTWTDTAGTFAFAELPAGDVCGVEATSTGFPSKDTRVQCAAGETSTVELRFDAPQSIEVTVVAAASGAPIRDAKVDLCDITDDGWSGLSGSQATDAAGRCVVADAPDGRLGVSVRAPGFLTAGENEPIAATRDAADSRSWRVEVRLQPAFVVAGRVLQADGSPAVGFSVQLTTSRDGEDVSVGSSEETHDDGTFRIEGLPAGAYSVCKWPDEKLTTAVAGGPDVLIRLTDEATGAAIELSLVGPDGAPVPTGRVEFKGLEGGGYGDCFKAGRLVVPAKCCSVGVGAVISVSMACDEERRPLPLGAAILSVPAPLPASLEIRVPAERVASGRVVGPDGGGVAARLSVRFAERGFTDEIARVLSAADGAFEIHQLGDGAYRLEVEPPKDFVPLAPVEIHGGDKDVVVTLAASACGVVTVLDYDGKPVRGAVVEVRATKLVKKDDEDEPKPLLHLVAGADGRARVNGIVPGTECALFVTGPANRDDLAPWSASPWTPHDVEVRLERKR